MCKPRLPVMMRLIENIMRWLHDLSTKQGKPISELYLDFNEVLTGTGPSAFTIAILAEMSKTTGDSVRWNRFTGLTEAKLVGGVLVLPVEAFAAGTGHSDSGNHKGKGAMVKHHFHASSWPSKHPRFKHPVYGEVEKCNWDLECVKLWDANTAFFDNLPEEERLEIISIKDKKHSDMPNAPITHDKASGRQDSPVENRIQEQSPLQVFVEDGFEESSGEPLSDHFDTSEPDNPSAMVLSPGSSEIRDAEMKDPQVDSLPPIGPEAPAELETAEEIHLQTRDTQDADIVPLAIIGGLTPGLDM